MIVLKKEPGLRYLEVPQLLLTFLKNLVFSEIGICIWATGAVQTSEGALADSRTARQIWAGKNVVRSGGSCWFWLMFLVEDAIYPRPYPN